MVNNLKCVRSLFSHNYQALTLYVCSNTIRVTSLNTIYILLNYPTQLVTPIH